MNERKYSPHTLNIGKPSDSRGKAEKAGDDIGYDKKKKYCKKIIPPDFKNNFILQYDNQQ